MFLPRADDPLLFASPTGLSFGLLQAGRRARPQTVKLTDAGGGAGPWTAAVQQQSTSPGVAFSVPASVTVPGSFAVKVTVGAKAAERDLTGFVVLTRGTDRRRIPYWLRIERPRLGLDPHGDARPHRHVLGQHGGPRRPRDDVPLPGQPVARSASPRVLAGPEQVFRVTLRKPVANFGAALLTRGAASVHIEPRVVVARRREPPHRLRRAADQPQPVPANVLGAPSRSSGAIRPKAGTYDIVFDTPSRGRRGPLHVPLLDRRQHAAGDQAAHARRSPSAAPLQLAVTDAGSSVDPSSLSAIVDGVAVTVALDERPRHDQAGPLGAGQAQARRSPPPTTRRRRTWRTSPKILPNTRVLRTTFTVG